jgi:conjugal transfer pilus assembly protein TraF
MSNARVINTKSIIYVIKTIYAILLLIVACSNNVYAGVGGFYKGEDRYRGFYWFEDQKTGLQNRDSFQAHYPSPDEAQTSIEVRKKEMDDARAQMVELGFREDTPPHVLRHAIVKYKKLEAQMHDGAIRLVHASEMANFTNPEIADVTEFPTNVYANKIKRVAENREKIEIVKEFAKKFDLLLFASPDCAYCKAFTPVITNFAKEHGFTLETASLNSSEGKIAQRLGINAVPTLVAVAKDGKRLFELSRGLSSLSELESNVVLAKNLNDEQGKKFNKSRR